MGNVFFKWTKYEIFTIKILFGPFFAMIYMGLIHSVIYATMNNEDYEKF